MTSLQRLYSFEMGTSGPQVVFLPGLGGTTRYWQGHLETLHQSRRVLLVDLLGFGESPKPWTRYSVEQHVAALHHLLKERGRFTLVGHSMGSLLALAYAAHYPHQVERLVLFSVPYFGSKDKALSYFGSQSALYRLFLANMALASLICIITRRIFGWLMPYLRPDLPRAVAADIVKHTWRSFTSSLWEVIYSGNVLQAAEALDARIPVLCLHGDQDPVAPLDGVLALAGRRPNWRVRVLPGVDHHPLFRVPDICLRAISSVQSEEGAYPVLHKLARLAAPARQGIQGGITK